ncbi:MAG: AmpG family muropeptide MFS transporter [Porticoccaceae bacterium]|jgi:PAT family beta-lactamase induction signal transducer AmpG|nr:AmpG family muropeptide MFS transporter [Porticoccaceae bacterium]MBT3799050.1 AmpG family muropeptide MFS transporter [Porticoccaceae bacterium]MBT4164748.1 AmpG family muropeptide MFS transporter [Porticoccaceae bacterium]MBT4210323.1 AmpG family muropeptide MFS transporter [Porticoccaceae bacterium]MBT4591803.1 AmpG family muropeptide MFS transporter [Porticoccaceae bacterium]
MSQQTIKQSLFNRRMLICIFTGFASGMPLYVLISLVPAWLRTEGVGLKEIGMFALIGLPYVWKFIWSPLLDRYSLSLFTFKPGLRRSWMLSTQLLLLITIAALGLLDPLTQLWPIAWLCLGIAFLSATQDIVLDAYRRQILPDQELGLGNSIHVNAYRVGGLIPGSLSLVLSDFLPWETVFLITAAFVLVGIVLTLTITEPPRPHQHPTTLQAAVVEPFHEFFSRQGVQQALLILAFMLLYKLGDGMATALATPFYLDMGYSKTEIGIVAKQAALWPVIIGGIAGGILMLKIGINRALWLFGLVQIVSILGFAVLARVGEGLWLLGLVIGFEYLGVGLGTAAFVAFIARTTNPAFAATQFALFTAVTAVPRTVASATTGIIVESIGWENFFYMCTLIAIPGMLLLFKVAPWNADKT